MRPAIALVVRIVPSAHQRNDGMVPVQELSCGPRSRSGTKGPIEGLGCLHSLIPNVVRL
jgi:hypothetical protein